MTREALLSPWKRPQTGWRTHLETTPGLGEKSRRSQGWVAASGALILFLLAPGTAHAQSGTYARLVGTVTDQTGAVLPGVEVTQVARRDFEMTPGEISEQVTVMGQSPIIDTDAVEVASLIEEKKILDLPLRGRDLLKLAFLTTGATQFQTDVGAEVGDNWGGGYPSFNGLHRFSNQITLDGANNQGYTTQRPVVQATPETVQEFKVITNNYSAEYGRVGGAVISMLSKSGSNEFHGHGWYYVRDEAFDAANFFANKTGTEKLPVNYQIFGGSVGGPIFKDKTFFHAHYERFIDDFERVDFATVPSAALRSGDFQGAGATGSVPQLYNPFDVVGGQRTPFEGNQIPRSLWSPIYQKVLEFMPPPEANVPGASSRNYSYPNTRNTRVNKYSTRFDHHLAGGDTLFGRFSWQSTPETLHARDSVFGEAHRIGLPGAELHGMSRSLAEKTRGWQTALGWVNPMGSNLVTELNVSIWKFSWLRSKPLHETNFAELLGYDDADRHPVFYPDVSRGPGNMPGIVPIGYTGWRGTSEWPISDWGLGFKYAASWRRGNHYLKFGVEHTRNLDVKNNIIGAYSFGGDYFNGFGTGQISRDGEGNTTGASFGEPWADFMLGLPNFTSGNVLGRAGFFSHFNQSHYNGFVNDDWKVGPNLTLNLGLRWEQPLPPYYEGSPDGEFATDYFYCAFDYSRASNRIDPVQMMPQGFDIPQWQGPTGLAVPFENLSRRGCYEANWHYFAPRFGLAWRMFGGNRTVLRLGVGLTYDQEFGILRSTLRASPLGGIIAIAPRGAETPSLFLGQRLSLPTLVDTNEFSGGWGSELEWEEGQVYSYNLSIQHEIFTGTKLEIGYVGNQGRHIREFSPFNVAMPEGYVAPLIDGTMATLTSDPVTAGSRPWIPGDTGDRVWSGQRARRPYPQVLPDLLIRGHGNTYYNSLQAKLERRFQDGVALTLGYTWSKAMALNFGGDWGQSLGATEYERHTLKTPMTHDRSQTLYSSAIWQLPFFRNGAGLARTLLGGWEATSIVTLTSGSPYLIYYNRDLWNQGARNGVRMNRIGDGYLGENERSVDRWFDTSAFVAPVYDSSLCQGADICHEAARQALGNSAFFPLRGDGIPVVDISLHKEFAFGEGKSLDFRADLFNAFNHTIFFSPIGFMAFGSAGRVTQAASARQIQFGFRFSF